MMMFGHSRFLPLMLDTEDEVQKQKDKIAYRASLSIVDQKILYLMFLYEKNGVDLCNFKPFLWGPSAVSFYSLHKKASVLPLDSIADGSLYDPRFLLPLLFTLLAPESLVNCRQIVETRCLSLILMSLSSEVFEPPSPVLMCLALSPAIWCQPSTSSAIPAISCSMQLRISCFAKPVLDIENVPDFYKMFYNYRVEHYMKRNWHLEVMGGLHALWPGLPHL
ncbi:hypothetical protein MRX96_016420 [Rhipicephalus microplus]